MDKQIINEIDISKCEFCYSGKYCHIYSGTADSRWLCEENEDCQIKKLLLQLKAKEQECEELKDLNTRLDNQRETYWEGYQKLKATLQEIKDYCNKYPQNSIGFKKQILQKISEVENEN